MTRCSVVCPVHKSTFGVHVWLLPWNGETIGILVYTAPLYMLNAESDFHGDRVKLHTHLRLCRGEL